MPAGKRPGTNKAIRSMSRFLRTAEICCKLCSINVGKRADRLDGCFIVSSQAWYKPSKALPRWSINLFPSHGSSLRLEVEPGFDFDEAEMKKLKIWPGGVIPYYIDEFSFDKVLRDRIRSILQETNSMTGVNFVELQLPPKDEVTRWIFFLNRQGLLNCVDHSLKNFTNEGVQKIVLGYDCLNSGGEFAQILLAILGVPPQHNDPVRTRNIEIRKDNIMPGKEHLFNTLQNNEWLFHGIKYDFASAGHYNLHKHTKNGQATIVPVHMQKYVFGEPTGFSDTDIWKIRMIYNYISQKQFQSVREPDCNKLYNPGTNISSPVHGSNEEVRPRKKPNEYLGLHEEPMATTHGANNINKTISSNRDKELSEEVVEGTKSENDKDYEGQKSGKSKENMHHKDNSENNEKSTLSAEENKEEVINENSLGPADSKADEKDKKKELSFRPPGNKKFGK